MRVLSFDNIFNGCVRALPPRPQRCACRNTHAHTHACADAKVQHVRHEFICLKATKWLALARVDGIRRICECHGSDPLRVPRAQTMCVCVSRVGPGYCSGRVYANDTDHSYTSSSYASLSNREPNQPTEFWIGFYDAPYYMLRFSASSLCSPV